MELDWHNDINLIGINPPVCIRNCKNKNQPSKSLSCYKDFTIDIAHNNSNYFMVALCSPVGYLSEYINQSWAFSNLTIRPSFVYFLFFVFFFEMVVNGKLCVFFFKSCYTSAHILSNNGKSHNESNHQNTNKTSYV